MNLEVVVLLPQWDLGHHLSDPGALALKKRLEDPLDQLWGLIRGVVVPSAHYGILKSNALMSPMVFIEVIPRSRHTSRIWRRPRLFVGFETSVVTTQRSVGEANVYAIKNGSRPTSSCSSSERSGA